MKRSLAMLATPFLHREPPVQALLFDLGYSLWERRADEAAWEDAERASDQRAVTLLRRHLAPAWQLPLDDDAFGALVRARFDALEHDFLRSHPGREPDGPQLVQQVLQEWGLVVEPTLSAAIFAALDVRFPPTFRLPADTLPTLAALRRQGFRLGIVTNRLWGGPTFRADLEQMGLLAFFEPKGIAVSAELGVRKPDARLFLAALEGLEVAPAAAVMIGDSLRSDILGAQRLGMLTVWKPRPRQRALIQARAEAGVPLPQAAGGEAGALPLLRAREPASADDTPDEDYQPATGSGWDGYLERYLRGELRPDVVIEQTSDLLEVFGVELPRR
jgi:putative hydrolase of the HAD superfamily